MPLVDSNDPTLYDGGSTSLYLSSLGTGLDRTAFLEGYRMDTQKLIEALVSVGLQKGQRIGIVRSEFGWIAEEFIAQGYGPIGDGTTAGRIVCVDTSTWIQANKNGQATLNIINADVNNATGRRAIRDQLNLSGNTKLDWGISYEALPMLSDAECSPFASSMRQLCTNVVHWLTPLMAGPPQQDARLNLKTLQAWKTLMTPDYIVWMGRTDIL